MDSNLESSILRFLDIESIIQIFGGRWIDGEDPLGSQIISRLEFSLGDTRRQCYPDHDKKDSRPWKRGQTLEGELVKFLGGEIAVF